MTTSHSSFPRRVLAQRQLLAVIDPRAEAEALVPLINGKLAPTFGLMEHDQWPGSYLRVLLGLDP
jgi:hypothetical protein